MSVIRAIDTGYGMTKFTLINGSEPVCHCFPSIATWQKETVGEGILETLDTVTLNIDGSHYEVGPEVVLARGRERARILHGDYTASPEYRALTLGALDYMRVNTIDLLVLGLPVNLTDSRSRLLRERFQGRQCLAANRTLDIRDVVVIARLLGGLIPLYAMRWAMAGISTRLFWWAAVLRSFRRPSKRLFPIMPFNAWKRPSMPMCGDFNRWGK